MVVEAAKGCRGGSYEYWKVFIEVEESVNYIHQDSTAPILR